MKRYFAFALLASLIIGCSKDEDTTPLTTGDYLPLTIGSTWSYTGETVVEGTTYLTDNTTTVTSNTKIIDGNTYVELEGNPTNGSTSKAYYREQNDEYHTVGFMSGDLEDLKLIILKKNEQIGVEWFSEYAFEETTNRYTFSILQKGVKHTVLGIEYTDVIKVHMTVSTSDLGHSFSLSEQDIYFAKDVGIVQTETSSIFGEASYDLDSYEIK